jgi:hypothetical protein
MIGAMGDDVDDVPPRRFRPLVLVVPGVVIAAIGAFVYVQMSAPREISQAVGVPVGATISATEVVVDDRVGVGRGGLAQFRRATLAIAAGGPHDVRIEDQPKFVPDHCDLTDEVAVGDDHLTFTGGINRRRLVRHAPHPLHEEPPTEPPSDAPSFASPRFLRVGDPSVLLVLHDTGDERMVAQVTRVDATGRAMWTVEIDGVCEAAGLGDGVLAITTTDPAHRALGIAVATGKVAWRFASSDAR